MTPKNDSNLAKLSNEIDFTKTIIEHGDPSYIVEESEWFEFESKLLFDKSCLKRSLANDPDRLIGFNLNSDHLTLVRQRLGYFNSQITKILQRIIQTMRLNEKAHISFELDPDLLNESFQNEKVDNKIYLDLKFEIILTKIEKNDPNQSLIYNLKADQLLTLSNEHKTDANELFKNSFVLTAFQRYHKAMSYLIIAEQMINEKKDIKIEDLETISETENETNHFDVAKLKSQLFSNLAACQLKSKNYKMVITNCGKCLELDKMNVKALFRRSSAFTEIKDFELAIEDLRIALALETDNIDVKKKLVYVEGLKKQYEQSMASKFKKMFV